MVWWPDRRTTEGKETRVTMWSTVSSKREADTWAEMGGSADWACARPPDHGQCLGTQSWALPEPRRLDFTFQDQTLQFKNRVSCLPHLLCSYLWKQRACSSRLIVLIQVYSSNFPASKHFFSKVKPVCQTVQLILPGRFEKISELQMGPRRFQWEWIFQQVWITVIKNLFQG